MRQRREEQGITLITIAEQTKIKFSLLEGLERDDVSHWPPGIFRRAYIRAYAHAIGLNPDVVVAEFLEVHPEPAEFVATALANAVAADAVRPNAGPPTRLRYIVGSAFGSFSRLRRSPMGEDLVAGSAPIHLSPAEADIPAAAPRAAELDRPAVAESSREPTQAAETNAAVAASTPMNEPVPPDPDWLAVAHLCTEFGRVGNRTDMQQLLQQAAAILDAPGLIVWLWDAEAEGLRPALAHGYSDRVLAQIPAVGRDADNATAAAFRSGHTSAIRGSAHASGALVVPLLTLDGCAGVLALELQNGREQTASVRAVATIFAALLAQLAGGSREAETPPEAETAVEPVQSFTPPIARAGLRR